MTTVLLCTTDQLSFNHPCLITTNTYINNSNIFLTVYGALIMAHLLWESPGSFEECRLRTYSFSVPPPIWWNFIYILSPA